MERAAMTSRFFTDCSSSARIADPESIVSQVGLTERIAVSRLAWSMYSKDSLSRLTNSLISFSEHAYMMRDADALQETAKMLVNVPTVVAQQVGFYYHALAINRKGLRSEAENLLEKVANSAPITYRARAIQTLAANHHDRGNFGEALRLQLEALRMASDKTVNGLQTTLLAHLGIGIIKSLNGDHEGALGVLAKLSPLVRVIARESPLYFYFYHNELAVELAELGRLAEAEAACAIALASPFSPAYPEWSATRDEIAAKRTSATPSVVAINRTPEAIPRPQMQSRPRSQPKLIIAFSWPARTEYSFQRPIIPTPARVAFQPISILERMLVSVAPRAPPSLP